MGETVSERIRDLAANGMLTEKVNVIINQWYNNPMIKAGETINKAEVETIIRSLTKKELKVLEVYIALYWTFVKYGEKVALSRARYETEAERAIGVFRLIKRDYKAGKEPRKRDIQELHATIDRLMKNYSIYKALVEAAEQFTENCTRKYKLRAKSVLPQYFWDDLAVAKINYPQERGILDFSKKTKERKLRIGAPVTNFEKEYAIFPYYDEVPTNKELYNFFLVDCYEEEFKIQLNYEK